MLKRYRIRSSGKKFQVETKNDVQEPWKKIGIHNTARHALSEIVSHSRGNSITILWTAGAIKADQKQKEVLS
jgi:hypothetical protein